MTAKKIADLDFKRYINAHDTYTIYGGSRLSTASLNAMADISRTFVNIEELQTVVGKEIAALTQNEAAYVCNGASGGMLLAAAVCLSGGDMYAYSQLPKIVNEKKDIIVMRGQWNAYAKAIETSGANVVKIGDADETNLYELEGAISSSTAAIFYFASMKYAGASLPLKEVINVANKYNVPVVVDAAAQLPPVENLWRFSEMGAAMTIFSGGKTLCGPQESGLIVGKKDFIKDCIRFGAPNHGVCRSSKVSREGMAGLYNAVVEYIQLDHKANDKRLRDICKEIEEAVCNLAKFTEIIEHGPVGQTYPRVFAYFSAEENAQEFKEYMYSKQIYIGTELTQKAVYFSPLNLKQEEVETVIKAIEQYSEKQIDNR